MCRVVCVSDRVERFLAPLGTDGGDAATWLTEYSDQTPRRASGACGPIRTSAVMNDRLNG